MSKRRVTLNVGMVVGLIALIIMPFVVSQPVFADSVTVTASKDTYLRQDTPSTNYGSATDLRVGGDRWADWGPDSNAHRSLVGFDLPTLPADATIDSVSLQLYYMGNSGTFTGGRTLQAARLHADRLTWAEHQASWTCYQGASPGCDAWTSAGCSASSDRSTSGATTAVVPGGALPGGSNWMTWDATTMVNYYYDNDLTQASFIITDYNEDNGDMITHFYSRNYGSYQPRLVINYTVPDPVVAPTVSTSSATSVGTTTATLQGSLTADGGESCSTRFQYGTTTAYGTNTAWDSGYVTGNTFTRAISGLAPGTTYHYRAQASNTVGSGSGSDVTFATRPNPPTTFTATAGNTEVDLTWAKGTGADKTMIRRSTSSYPTSPTSGTQVYYNTGTSHTDTGLTNGTTYYYAAWSWANDVYSSTRATDTATPSAPAAPTATTNAATAVTNSAARLHMNLDSLGGATEADVNFEYYKEGAAEWGQSTAVSTYYSPGTHYADIAGLDAASVYYFRAKAVSVHGTGYGSSRSFTTGGLSAPTMTTNAATGVTQDTGVIHGAVTADGGASVTVWFQWGYSEGNLAYTTGAAAGYTTGDTFYTSMPPQDPDTTIYFRAMGENSEGSAYGATLNFTTSSPSAPDVRTDTATAAANQATLRATLVADSGVDCSVRFQWGLTNAYGNDTPWVEGYSAGDTISVLITGLDLATEYHFRAQAMNAGGTTSGDDATFTTVFAAPTDFAAKTLNQSTVTLTWVPGGDMTMVRYSTGGYPSTISSGTQAYFGAGASASVSSLDAATTYYFRAWSWREGNVFTETYSDDIATTLAVAPGTDPDPIEPPDTPSRWFAMPSGNAMTNMPFYDEAIGFADSLELPHGTFWFTIAVGLMIIAGGLAYKCTHRAIAAVLVAGGVVIILTLLTMMPLWFLLMYLALGGGSIYVAQRV
jgi:hypothetical protein